MNQPNPSTAPEDDRRFATTLARGLAVLRAFRSSDDGLGNGEIAERTGLPKSTVSRLSWTLHQLGYLTHAGRADRYRPGPALLALGNVAAASISFVGLAGPIMQRLADDTGTLALLLVRDQGKLLIVKTWRPRGVSSLWLEAGHRVPVVGSSSGRALLATQTDEAFERTMLLAGADPGAAREARRDAWSQLLGRGYVIHDPAQYFAPSIHAVARPFQSADLSEPVIFTCGAMPADLSVERMRDAVGPALDAGVKDLERNMGQAAGSLFRE